MVYFHAVDVVLGRKDRVRQAWVSRCHLPLALFDTPKKGRRKRATATSRASQKNDYGCIKRMIACKDAVFSRHKGMLRIYENYCNLTELTPYWGEDEGDFDGVAIAPAETTNEADCDHEF